MRCAHTWKGAASSVGLESFADLVHQVEQYLELHLKSPVLPPINSVISLGKVLAKAADYLRRQQGILHAEQHQALVQAIQLLDEEGEQDPLNSSRMSSIDSSLVSSDSSVQSATGSRSGSTSSADNKSQLLDRAIRVPVERIEQLIDGVSELMIGRAKLSHDLSSIGSLQHSVKNAQRRLAESLDSFSSTYEFGQQTSASQMISSFGGMNVSSASGGNGDDQPNDDDFLSSEWDQYDDVNIMARNLRELGDDLREAHNQIERQVDVVQDQVRTISQQLTSLQSTMGELRTVPVRVLFNRLRLSALEAADQERKTIQVVLVGQESQLDKIVVDRLLAPLTHAVRNAVAHGIESADIRQAGGKTDRGVVTIAAESQGGEIIITVSDDGAGIDRARVHRKGIELGLLPKNCSVDDSRVLDVLFQPGFTTRDQSTQVAGRGVGCDVLLREVQAAGGTIAISTAAHKGTSFIIRMPTSIVVNSVLFVGCGQRTLALNMQHIERVYDQDSMSADGRIIHDDIDYAVTPLGHYLHLSQPAPKYALVVSVAGKQHVIGVDSLLGRDEIVTRQLGSYLDDHPAFSGMTISGDGEPVLVLDMTFFTQQSAGGRGTQQAPALGIESSQPEDLLPEPATQSSAPPYILVVDDSISVRKVAERHLSNAGYMVKTAPDGRVALDLIAEQAPQLIFTDLEMPVLDGLSFIRSVRGSGSELPMIVISSRGSAKHRDAATAAGANDYLVKPFDEASVIACVRQYLGQTKDA